MSEITLIVPERFDLARTNSLRRALGTHLRVGEPQYLKRRSADPSSLPSFIQLLGDVDAWSLLLLPATAFWTAYFATMGKHTANATRDGIASLLKRKDVKPLAECSEALTTAMQKVDGEVEIIVGLNIPDDRDGTAISVKSRDPTDIALAIATIIIHAKEISIAMQTEIAASGKPAGPVCVTLEADGSVLLKWKSGSAFEEREARITSQPPLQP